jgi:hypothetical protein
MIGQLWAHGQLSNRREAAASHGDVERADAHTKHNASTQDRRNRNRPPAQTVGTDDIESRSGDHRSSTVSTPSRMSRRTSTNRLAGSSPGSSSGCIVVRSATARNAAAVYPGIRI